MPKQARSTGCRCWVTKSRTMSRFWCLHLEYACSTTGFSRPSITLSRARRVVVPPNISGQDHQVMVLHWRPSRCKSSSASFGPHDPGA